MKIGLISCHSFNQYGGVKNHILGLHSEFKKRGIESKIIAPRRFQSEDYGKDVILLGTSFPLNFAGTQADFDINFNPIALDKALKEEKFDILHFHNFGFPSAIQVLERSKALNILTFHANLEASGLFKMAPGLFYFFNKIADWKIDGIIGVAPLNLEVFKDFSGPKKVIPNGIDIKKFNPQVPIIKRFSDPQKINILFVGRIEERKGLIYLLRSYEILEKEFSNLRLIIVGDGPLKQECMNFAKEHNLENIYFEGEQDEKEKQKYFNTCDIFCSPAIFGESFGIVLLEAMACKKPVAGFANLGYKQLLRGKRGGNFLARPKDYKSLAKKIETLIKSKKLREEMGEWGIKEAQKYSWPKVADRVLDFYKYCQENKKRTDSTIPF
ncbi:MAG: glycosyltransferase family 4 protein [Candidatus Nealsonbacteria bacterium]|nr:glycosyltransferase family 4 protein [Candidatus Nealsonbacteria bacterium]